MREIIGNTTATPNPRPDWNQTDEAKADYIKNKPTILTEADVLNIVTANGGGGDASGVIIIGDGDGGVKTLTYNGVTYNSFPDKTARDDIAALNERVDNLPDSGGGGSSIDDSVASLDSTWSSQKISEELAKLSYEPIAVKSFAASPGTAEVGSTVNVTLSWQFNKKPSSVTVDGSVVEANESGSYTVSASKPTNYPNSISRSWSLTAKDNEGETATKSASISFYNAVYYGGATKPNSYDSDFILLLDEKSLRGNKLPSFHVSLERGEYIYYCLPTRYGTCLFSVNGFTGGFVLDGTVSFTNAYGYSENYYVYRSTNTLNGEITITVS